MRHVRTADRLSFALCFAFVLLGGPPARAESGLESVEPGFREVLQPSLGRLFGSNREELARALAAERAWLEQAVRDEPDTRMEASIVFRRPFERDGILGLQSVLGAEMLSLTAAVTLGSSVYSRDHDLLLLRGDLAAQLAAIDERQRTGRMPTPGRLLGAHPVSSAGGTQPTPLQFVEARLVSTPRQLLRELERDPRILAIKLRSVAWLALPLP